MYGAKNRGDFRPPRFCDCDVIASSRLHLYPGRRLKIKAEPEIKGIVAKDANDFHGSH
jgi:hypothetical protein